MAKRIFLMVSLVLMLSGLVLADEGKRYKIDYSGMPNVVRVIMAPGTYSREELNLQAEMASDELADTLGPKGFISTGRTRDYSQKITVLESDGMKKRFWAIKVYQLKQEIAKPEQQSPRPTGPSVVGPRNRPPSDGRRPPNQQPPSNQQRSGGW